jgi:hypothetical protein
MLAVMTVKIADQNKRKYTAGTTIHVSYYEIGM